MMVLQSGIYYCFECGFEIEITQQPQPKDTYIRGWCNNDKCGKHHKLLRIPMERIEVETA